MAAPTIQHGRDAALGHRLDHAGVVVHPQRHLVAEGLYPVERLELECDVVAVIPVSTHDELVIVDEVTVQPGLGELARQLRSARHDPDDVPRPSEDKLPNGDDYGIARTLHGVGNPLVPIPLRFGTEVVPVRRVRQGTIEIEYPDLGRAHVVSILSLNNFSLRVARYSRTSCLDVAMISSASRIGGLSASGSLGRSRSRTS